MAERGPEDGPRGPAGGDWILPAAGIAFALYYISTVWDLPWEARANGLLLGSILLGLTAIFFVRAALALRGRRVTLSLAELVEPRALLVRRLGLFLLVVGFIAALPYLGFTLTVLAFMVGALLLLGERRPGVVAALALTVAAVGYLLFIVFLRARLPRGPIEGLLAWIV
jgi:hypothetical protein